MERVVFVAPASSRDLRVVLSRTAPTIPAGDYQVSYATPFNEIRSVKWLTQADAHTRAKLLIARGYRSVSVSRWQ